MSEPWTREWSVLTRSSAARLSIPSSRACVAGKQLSRRLPVVVSQYRRRRRRRCCSSKERRARVDVGEWFWWKHRRRGSDFLHLWRDLFSEKNANNTASGNLLAVRSGLVALSFVQLRNRGFESLESSVRRCRVRDIYRGGQFGSFTRVLSCSLWRVSRDSTTQFLDSSRTPAASWSRFSVTEMIKCDCIPMVFKFFKSWI